MCSGWAYVRSQVFDCVTHPGIVCFAQGYSNYVHLYSSSSMTISVDAISGCNRLMKNLMRDSIVVLALF